MNDRGSPAVFGFGYKMIRVAVPRTNQKKGTSYPEPFRGNRYPEPEPEPTAEPGPDPSVSHREGLEGGDRESMDLGDHRPAISGYLAVW